MLGRVFMPLIYLSFCSILLMTVIYILQSSFNCFLTLWQIPPNSYACIAFHQWHVKTELWRLNVFLPKEFFFLFCLVYTISDFLSHFCKKLNFSFFLSFTDYFYWLLKFVVCAIVCWPLLNQPYENKIGFVFLLRNLRTVHVFSYLDVAGVPMFWFSGVKNLHVKRMDLLSDYEINEHLRISVFGNKKKQKDEGKKFILKKDFLLEGIYDIAF